MLVRSVLGLFRFVGRAKSSAGPTHLGIEFFQFPTADPVAGKFFPEPHFVVQGSVKDRQFVGALAGVQPQKIIGRITIPITETSLYVLKLLFETDIVAHGYLLAARRASNSF